MLLNQLNEILDEIGNELTTQISLSKDIDRIDIAKLSRQSKTLTQIILESEISKENKSMLQKFSLTLQEGVTERSLRYEKQDLERVLANLKD